jgi:hypothetical protein
MVSVLEGKGVYNHSIQSCAVNCCRSPWYRESMHPLELTNAPGLREILSSCIVHHLAVLWLESRNPVLWVLKILVLTIFLNPGKGKFTK